MNKQQRNDEKRSDQDQQAQGQNAPGTGEMSVSEAGRKGGETTASTHGREFYQEIGQKGGEIGGQRVKELVERGKEAEKDGQGTTKH